MVTKTTQRKGEKVKVGVAIAQTRYYAQGEPLALTASNELRKLPSVTSDLRRLTKQVDKRAFHYNTTQRKGEKMKAGLCQFYYFYFISLNLLS